MGHLRVSPIKIRRFHGSNWRDLEVKDSGGLRKICEWSCNGSDLKFAGFESETGMWQEYILQDFGINISDHSDSALHAPRG